MKEKNFVGFIITFLFALLVFSYSASALRLLPHKLQGEKEEAEADHVVTQPALFTDTEQDFLNLMGSEDCNEKDEECLRRRMIAEAHLDYIYTQHHKPQKNNNP